MQLNENVQLPRVERSFAAELTWVLCTASYDPAARHACTADAVYSDPELCDEVREFWGAGSVHGAELLVLADQAGVLFELDPETVFTALGRRQRDPGPLRLASESGGGRELALERLGQLRRSAALRRRYVDLLRRAWATVEGDYAASGDAAAAAALVQYRERLAGGASWRDFVANPVADPILTPILDLLGPTMPVVIVVSYFFGKLLTVDLAEFLIVGAGAGSTARSADEHEALAKRLRALGHPTRLGILASLSGRSCSVGELAAEFGVAQPTVSNHLKLLREAGLLRSERDGGRLLLRVDADALAKLVDEFGALTSSPLLSAHHDPVLSPATA